MESDNDSDIGDILDDLLANGNDTEKIPPKKQLEELTFNFLDSHGNIDEKCKVDSGESSLVREIGADSSDDEDKRNFEEQKYSEYGRDLKNLLKNDAASKTTCELPTTYDKSSNSVATLSGNIEKPLKIKSQNSFDFNERFSSKSRDVYSDPIFGLRIVKPLISSTELANRMQGRKAVTVSKIKNHLSSESTHDDWVIAGVLINRSATKTSQKGSQYCIWKLSDLGDEMNAVSMFLFSGAYKLFWKTAPGTVIGILNPTVMESKDYNDLATLSVDNAQKVMIFGNSRDMGKCKSMKKNGEPCSSVVNLSRCEYCVYHVKQEYKKASRRSDIQANGNSSGFSSSLGKKEKTPISGMYSQGMNNPSFTPILAKRNEKLYQKDSARLALLRGTVSMPELSAKVESVELKKKSFAVELSASQVKKDLDRLNKLRGWSVSKPVTSVATSTEASSPASDIAKKSQIFSLNKNSPIPRLGLGAHGGKIDFSEPITKRHIDGARANAARWIKENGTLKQSNPNKVMESREKKLNAGTKRRREATDEDREIENNRKKPSISEKFKEMMDAKSSHTDLVEKSQQEEEEKYFNKLAIKERMEEKMMNTYKIECKAVKCLVCKYTAYSGSDLCKERKHPLRVIDAVKSFFKCNDCGNRTTSLDRIPSESCKKCQGSHWIRAAMMAEKMSNPSAVLSIRGGEEKFIGSTSQDANINLLVPDSGTADS